MSLAKIEDAIIPVLVVYQTVDEYGRLGSISGVFRTEEDADVGAVGQGWYGSKGKVIMKHAVQDGENLYILEGFGALQFKDVTVLREQQHKEKVNKLLSKLTEDEISLLRSELK